jgi:hypothetical protein
MIDPFLRGEPARDFTDGRSADFEVMAQRGFAQLFTGTEHFGENRPTQVRCSL